MKQLFFQLAIMGVLFTAQLQGATFKEKFMQVDNLAIDLSKLTGQDI